MRRSWQQKTEAEFTRNNQKEEQWKRRREEKKRSWHNCKNGPISQEEKDAIAEWLAKKEVEKMHATMQ